MTEKIKHLLTKRRLIFIAIANAVALALLLNGSFTGEQFINYSIAILRLIVLGV